MKNWKIQLLIITAITIIAFINIFPNNLAVDDKTFIAQWPEIRSLSNIPKFFQGDVPQGHEGVYRPIRGVLYSIYYQFFGTNPFGYHLHSLLIHLASTILVYFIVLEIIKRPPNLKFKISNLKLVPFAAALLFGVHPIHTETITYIAASMEATGIVFFFASFYFYLRGVRGSRGIGIISMAASVIFALLAFFTYEVTLTLPLLIVLYEICFSHFAKASRDRQSWIKRVVPYFVLALVYFLIRFFVLHITSRGPYLAGSFYLTVLTMTKVFVKYITLVVWPFNLSLNHIISKGIEAFVYRDYRTEAIVSQSLFDKDIVIAIVIIASLLVIAWKIRKKFPIITFCIGWFFITLLPVSEIVPQGSMMNEKFLYLPSFGFVLVLVYVILIPLSGRRIPRSFASLRMTTGGFGMTILILIALFYSYLTIQRNRDWNNDITIWSKDVQNAPNDNAYAYFALGNAYEDNSQLPLALKEYKKSFEINPHFVVGLASEGVVYANMGKPDLAIETYKKAITISPYFWEAHNNLGNIYLNLGKSDLAEGEYRQTLSIKPDFAPAQFYLDSLLSNKIGTPSATGKQDNWTKYSSKDGGFSFKYPSSWTIREKDKSSTSLVLDKRLILENDTKTFTIEFSKGLRSADLSAVDYVKKQTQTYGKLVNQGLAKIPNMDFGFVKVWDPSAGHSTVSSDRIGSGENKPKLQFFLFKKDKVIQVLVYPGDSALMKQFDSILGSLEMK